MTEFFSYPKVASGHLGESFQTRSNARRLYNIILRRMLRESQIIGSAPPIVSLPGHQQVEIRFMRGSMTDLSPHDYDYQIGTIWFRFRGPVNIQQVVPAGGAHSEP